MSKIEEENWRMKGSETRGNYPTKIFWCKFCGRAFYSSQALGGHQNAHKRERSLVRYFEASSMSKSLGVQPHAHLHKPPTDGALTALVDPEFMWPDSYHNVSASSSDTLDLNLKL